MPRTSTTVINDVIREAGQLQGIDANWTIPVERSGWECGVMISVHLWDRRDERGLLYISVYAYGSPTGEGSPPGNALYGAIHGYASPSRLTRKWIESVLRREIETARAAALSFTETDLHEGFAPTASEEYFRGMREYFESSLSSEGQ